MGKTNPVFIKQGKCLYRHIYGLFNARILTIQRQNKQIVDRTLGTGCIYSENVFPKRQASKFKLQPKKKDFSQRQRSDDWAFQNDARNVTT